MYCLPWLSALRAKGINAEIYPEPAKMKKQMSYADNKRIPFVAIVGETEMNEGKVMLKNMKTGEQELATLEEIVIEDIKEIIKVEQILFIKLISISQTAKK